MVLLELRRQPRRRDPMNPDAITSGSGAVGMTTYPAADRESPDESSRPEVRTPDSFYGGWPRRVMLVRDVELGVVVVRWRYVPGATWRWRCGACGGRSSHPSCRHALAAATFLAGEHLGLDAEALASLVLKASQAEANERSNQ